MKSVVKLLITLTLALAASAAFGQSPAQVRYALVLAKPVSMTFVRDLTSQEPDVYVHGAVYTATLRSVRTLYGSFAAKETLKVDLTASHVESVTSHAEIYLYLEIDASDAVRVLYWGVPETIVCVPSELHPDQRLGPKFGGYESRNGALCSPPRELRR